jgi:hypothetical protein
MISGLYGISFAKTTILSDKRIKLSRGSNFTFYMGKALHKKILFIQAIFNN